MRTKMVRPAGIRTIFTGQRVVGEAADGAGRGTTDVVECQACKGPVSLRVAYIDRYTDAAPAEKYVHYTCLSPQRKQEIADLDARNLKA